MWASTLVREQSPDAHTRLVVLSPWVLPLVAATACSCVAGLAALAWPSCSWAPFWRLLGLPSYWYVHATFLAVTLVALFALRRLDPTLLELNISARTLRIRKQRWRVASAERTISVDAIERIDITAPRFRPAVLVRIGANGESERSMVQIGGLWTARDRERAAAACRSFFLELVPSDRLHQDGAFRHVPTLLSVVALGTQLLLPWFPAAVLVWKASNQNEWVFDEPVVWTPPSVDRRDLRAVRDTVAEFSVRAASVSEWEENGCFELDGRRVVCIWPAMIGHEQLGDGYTIHCEIARARFGAAFLYLKSRMFGEAVPFSEAGVPYLQIRTARTRGFLSHHERDGKGSFSAFLFDIADGDRGVKMLFLGFGESDFLEQVASIADTITFAAAPEPQTSARRTHRR